MQIGLLVVFGALGTLARYALQGWVQDHSDFRFPSGTLAVNVLGCFLLGVVGQFALRHITVPPDWRVGLTVGFFWAFTTFSTFGWETVRMLEDGEWMKVALYVGTGLIGGLLAIFLGIRLADML